MKAESVERDETVRITALSRMLSPVDSHFNLTTIPFTGTRKGKESQKSKSPRLT